MGIWVVRQDCVLQKVLELSFSFPFEIIIDSQEIAKIVQRDRSSFSYISHAIIFLDDQGCFFLSLKFSKFTRIHLSHSYSRSRSSDIQCPVPYMFQIFLFQGILFNILFSYLFFFFRDSYDPYVGLSLSISNTCAFSQFFSNFSSPFLFLFFLSIFLFL